MSDKDSTAYQRLTDLMIGAKIALALRAAAEYKIADKLASRPMSIEGLADITGLASNPLRRLLRAVAQFGIFKETEDGLFENTEISGFMRSDIDSSLREAILFLNSNVSLRAWLEFEQTLKDGNSRFVEVNGAPLFNLFKTDGRLSEYFGKCMVSLYGAEAAKIAAGYPFGDFRSLIDVGGGQGHILAAVLSTYKNLKGALFDIKPTADLARGFLGERGLLDRCKVIGGDFFIEVPGGYDAYIVKSVLHDWDDVKAIEILRQCRMAMSDSARLLVIEEVIVPRQKVGNPNSFVDLDLLVHLGGGERTSEEYEELLTGTGFSLKKIASIKDSFLSVIECQPV